LLGYGRGSLIGNGIVDSGDALTLGIGAMTDARWKAFYRSMTEVGVYRPGIDISKAYTTQFVNNGNGIRQKVLNR
jgi:NitT/TauT family transport system substrate-binding protein